ncbi:MAG: hypothetical protein ACK6DC_06000 [Planctomycetota bacterium]|jgi:hypothetical protein
MRLDRRLSFHSSLFSPDDTLRETTAAGPRFAKEAIMLIVSARIPRYLLSDGLGYASPRVLQPSYQIGLTVLYGFSDKPEYDTFISSSEIPLTPYPLVKGYLERAIDSNLLQLVVLDAGTSQQTLLQASTFEAILESLCNKLDTVPVTHRLMIDKANTAYLVEEINHLEGASHASVQG